MRAAARSERNETYKQRLSERAGNIASYCVGRAKNPPSAFGRRLQALSAVLKLQIKGQRVHVHSLRRMLLHIWALTSGRQVSEQAATDSC